MRTQRNMKIKKTHLVRCADTPLKRGLSCKSLGEITSPGYEL